ncbi:MAG: hypothetical protein KAX40_09020 [Herpetosiphon sp.]|nr:hypothetical protein [Herpetosiphon sp.]
MSDLVLRRKWTLKAHSSQIVLIKKPIESAEHVVMKALLWALYLPQYSQIQVEVSIGTRYKPDLIALDDQQQPIFWGEAGRVSEEKSRRCSNATNTRILRSPNGTHGLSRWTNNCAASWQQPNVTRRLTC